MAARVGEDWLGELEAWSEPFLDALGHPARRHWAPYYLRGLLLPGERKSVQPMATRLGLPAPHPPPHFCGSPASGGPPPEAGPAAPEAGAEREAGRGRGVARRRPVAPRRLAPRHEGAAGRRVRGPARARG